MKKFIIVCITLLSVSTLQAKAYDAADFFRSIFSIPAPVSEIETSSAAEMQAYTEEVNASLTDITTQESQIDFPTQNAFLSIISLISSSDEANAIKSKIGYINQDSSINYVEKSSEISEIISDYQKMLTENPEAKIAKIKALKAADKSALINSIKTLSENGEKYIELGRAGIKTVNNFKSQVKKDDNIVETIANIDNVTGRLSSKAAATVYLANQLKTISKRAGLTF